jgi:hypothetical protein
MFRHPDIVSGFLLVLFGIAVVYFSQSIDVSGADAALTARFFPILCGIGLTLTGGVIFIKGFFNESLPFQFQFNTRVTILMALLLVYFMTFSVVDFRLSAWALMASVMFLLGARDKKLLIWLPIATSAVTFVAFRYGFNILLPVWG